MDTPLSSTFSTLILRHPFVAAVAMQRERSEDPTCRTAWTDGKVLAVNPAWLQALGLEERVSVVAEAAYHVALAHHLRRGPREPGLWQLATDLAVNALLRADGFLLPEGPLLILPSAMPRPRSSTTASSRSSRLLRTPGAAGGGLRPVAGRLRAERRRGGARRSSRR